MSDSYLQASAVRSQDLHGAGSSASEAAVREAFTALAFADMAPLVAGEPWDRAGLPLAARASAERLTRQRDGMKPYVRHKLSLLEYSPLDTLDAPGRALILGHFGAACHRHSRLDRTIHLGFHLHLPTDVDLETRIRRIWSIHCPQKMLLNYSG